LALLLAAHLQDFDLAQDLLLLDWLEDLKDGERGERQMRRDALPGLWWLGAAALTSNTHQQPRRAPLTVQADWNLMPSCPLMHANAL